MHLLIQPTHRMLLRYHPEVGHLFVPNLNARVPNELGAFYVRTNSAGFRSDIEYSSKQGDRPRILFFGDSFTAGDGCSNHERFSDRVGAQLHAEVFNYGVSGTGTDQHLLIQERIAKRFLRGFRSRRGPPHSTTSKRKSRGEAQDRKRCQIIVRV